MHHPLMWRLIRNQEILRITQQVRANEDKCESFHLIEDCNEEIDI